MPAVVSAFIAAFLLLAPATSLGTCVENATKTLALPPAAAEHGVVPAPRDPKGVQASISAERAAKVATSLGLSPDAVKFHPLGAGGMNEVFDLASRNPGNPARFPKSSQVPEELWGKRVDGFKIKLVRSHTGDGVLPRDSEVLGVIMEELAHDPKAYEGVWLGETYLIHPEGVERRIIVQRSMKGQGLYEILDPIFAEAFKDERFAKHGTLNETKSLFANLIEGDILGWSTSKIFSSKNLKDRSGVLLSSPKRIAALKRAWEHDPDLLRVRDLMKKLYKLNRSPRMQAIFTSGESRKVGLLSRMPWTTRRGNLPPLSPAHNLSNGMRESIWADFSPNNFLLQRDASGKLHLGLFDF